MTFLNNLKTALLIAAPVALCFATSEPAQAAGLDSSQTNRWDMCRWDVIPDNVLRRIEKRDDYADILRRMFEYCPESALGLTDRPTATLSEASGVNDGGYGAGNRVNGRDEISGNDTPGGGSGGGSGGAPTGGGGTNNVGGEAQWGLPG